jgi:hypothetical protein
MLTGVMPLEHRVLDFLRVNPVSGQREPITSDERKAPAIWNMATNAGKRVAALGFWATYPAEAVNGLLVSDRLFTFLYSESEPPPGVVNPHDEDAWARETLKRVEQDVNYAQLREFLPALTEEEYRTAIAAKDPYADPVGALRRVLVETSHRMPRRGSRRSRRRISSATAVSPNVISRRSIACSASFANWPRARAPCSSSGPTTGSSGPRAGPRRCRALAMPPPRSGTPTTAST